MAPSTEAALGAALHLTRLPFVRTLDSGTLVRALALSLGRLAALRGFSLREALLLVQVAFEETRPSRRAYDA